MSRFGQIVYEAAGYIEFVLADEEQGTRCIACVQGSKIALFRIEWNDSSTGIMHNEARYDLLSAIAAFKDRLPTLASESDEEGVSQ